MTERLAVETIDWRSIGRLLLTSAAIMGSPGPVTISLTAAGSAYGAHRCAGYLAGIVAGTALVLIAVATGVTAAVLTVPGARPVLLAISAAYILWLAFRIATAPPLSSRTPSSAAPSFLGGTLLGVANPKAWVAIAAVFASTRLADGAAVDAVIKSAFLTGMIVVITTTWLMVGVSLSGALRDPVRSRIVNTALAFTLVVATAVAVIH